jgi:Protein of unknown function (DUF1376)
MSLPAPLTSAEVDLSSFHYMPLDVVRLRDCDLLAVASAEEFRAAVLLWCASWHQKPAASLPNDDRVLARLAGFGHSVKAWLKVKSVALRCFIECSDGRLYHPLIAEKAQEAFKIKISQSARATKKWQRYNGEKINNNNETASAAAVPGECRGNAGADAAAMQLNLTELNIEEDSWLTVSRER